LGVFFTYDSILWVSVDFDPFEIKAQLLNFKQEIAIRFKELPYAIPTIVELRITNHCQFRAESIQNLVTAC